MWRRKNAQKKSGDVQVKKENLLIHCSMKERGCDWSGTLDQLNTHLDPNDDNCQYVDTKCPLNCHLSIPKNKVEQHVAEECTKRPYVCQHCNFKATYKEVVEKHFQKCMLFSLQCKEENHNCVEEVEHDFSDLHSDGRRISEVKAQKHAFFSPSLNPNMMARLQELEQKLHDYELKFQQQDEEHRQSQDQLLSLLKQQDEKLQAYHQHLKDLQKEQVKLTSEMQEKDSEIKCLQQYTTFKRTYVVQNFSEVQRNGWRSRSSYLRMGGCKFGIIIDYTGHDMIRFSVAIKKGVFDQELKWPYCMSFTMEIVNQKGGSNLNEVFMGSVQRDLFYKVTCLELSDIGTYLRHDSLHLIITK